MTDSFLPPYRAPRRVYLGISGFDTVRPSSNWSNLCETRPKPWPGNLSGLVFHAKDRTSLTSYMTKAP